MSPDVGITHVRVRYQETDQAGVVYHSNYFLYFEIGRTEWLRERGEPYRALEETGTRLTVIEAAASFLGPARYDDLLRIETRIAEVGGARVRFDYDVFRDGESLPLCRGSTTLASIGRERGRACRLPATLRALFGR
ncbi:MAG: acyl-CoA thioesterase [Planctomycetes bacterium]|nr:acyl-CoA thioesterase [Planctomycetota bacterium]